MPLKGWQVVAQFVCDGPADQIQAALADAQLVSKATVDVVPSFGHLDGVRYEFRIDLQLTPIADATATWQQYFDALKARSAEQPWFLAGAIIPERTIERESPGDATEDSESAYRWEMRIRKLPHTRATDGATHTVSFWTAMLPLIEERRSLREKQDNLLEEYRSARRQGANPNMAACADAIEALSVRIREITLELSQFRLERNLSDDATSDRPADPRAS